MNNLQAAVLALACIFLLARPACADNGTEVVIGDDLTVLGTGGNWNDPDVKVSGSVKFGSPHDRTAAVNISSSTSKTGVQAANTPSEKAALSPAPAGIPAGAGCGTGPGPGFRRSGRLPGPGRW